MKNYYVRAASLNETQATTQPGHNVACGVHNNGDEIEVSTAFLVTGRQLDPPSDLLRHLGHFEFQEAAKP